MGASVARSLQDVFYKKPDRVLEELLEPVTITATSVVGETVEVSISPSLLVSALQEAIAGRLQERVAARRVCVVFGEETLSSFHKLTDCGINADVAVTVILGPVQPEWADEIGLGPEHPALLRQFYEQREVPDVTTDTGDEAIWASLENARKAEVTSKEQFASWGNKTCLWQAGKPVSILTARPCESVRFEVRTEIWNKKKDSCIHQLILLMDETIVQDVYSGVAGSGKSRKVSCDISAPATPGVYMLWKRSDLQYSMADAMGNTRREVASLGNKIHSKYPDKFVAWLVVQDR
eukprot:TRINITY_DN122915_c0_g1_i1.p1 TRINITY_DN122915_c0_g1~~TRINITY_DN122915_c0_g1_i1.p1  ORF type:complete len:293 (-),score=38.28 TRINITY_DN122915_c0_g1_i1:186-1064(-)